MPEDHSARPGTPTRTGNAAEDPANAETVFSRDDWRPGAIRHERGREAPPLAAGDVLFGAYEIVDRIGSGGMGEVFRARHRSLGGLRAIKVMSASLSADREALERFHREANALLEVHHPAVVGCHDLLRDEHGRVYLVMELVEGISLAARMKDAPLAEAELRELARRVGAGLESAHARGVIHRDVAPDNIVLPEGRPALAKLVDFGIAKLNRVGEETTTTGFKGKLAWASPEQLGFFDGEVGPASDFFSLGLVLCAAARGKRMQMGESFAAAVEARQKPIELPPELPAGLRAPVARLLRLDPAERPANVEALFRVDAGSPRRGISLRRIGAGVAAGVAFGSAVAGIMVYQIDSRRAERGRTTPPVAAPPPVVTREPIPEAAGPAPGASVRDATLRFQSLRDELSSLHGSLTDVAASLVVDPNPVPDLGTYVLEIQADCACYPLVFSISADRELVELLYPNPLEPIRPLERGRRLEIPSSSEIYSLEAQAGVGNDRLKLILLPQDMGFPAAAGAWQAGEFDPTDPAELTRLLEEGAVSFWSASPDEPERLQELARLISDLEDAAFGSAETTLHVIR